MDPVTLGIVTWLATTVFKAFAQSTVEAFFKEAFAQRPKLEVDLTNARSWPEFEKVFAEAAGVIDAAAGSGAINVDTGFVEALRGIRFDHQNGQVVLRGTVLKAPIIETGGQGTGRTQISGGSDLQSAGTRIHVGQGAQITMTGNAKIRQS